MELLDDYKNISTLSDREKLPHIVSTKKEYEAMMKSISSGNVMMWVIAGFTALSLISVLRSTDIVLELSVTLFLLAFFIIAPALDPMNSKYYFPIAMVIIVLGIISTFLVSPMLGVISIFVRGFFLYYIYKGFKASMNYTKIIEKMNDLDIKAYKLD